MGRTLHTLVRDLQRRRGRERRGLTLAEGIRLAEEVLAAEIPVRAALASPALEATPRGRSLKRALGARAGSLEEVSDRILDGLAATEHPQGVLLVIEPKRWRVEDIPVDLRSVVLVLDGLQDPGNVGTLARTALALGGAGLLALPGTAELANPKTLRAAMGALFRLPAVALDEPAALAWLRDRAFRLLVADAGAPPLGTPEPGPLALALGNEGSGVGPTLTRAASRRVGIRLAPGAESLNVGVAAGILLYEVLRER